MAAIVVDVEIRPSRVGRMDVDWQAVAEGNRLIKAERAYRLENIAARIRSEERKLRVMGYNPSYIKAAKADKVLGYE